MMTNPLGLTPLEVALGMSMLIGFAIAIFLLAGAARSRFGWLPASITSVLAVAVPILGPALALLICWNLTRTNRMASLPMQ